MAFFKLAKKKREEPLDLQIPSPNVLNQEQQTQSSPVEQVIMMKQQGYTNNQVIQTLQSQGYNTSQIYDAINHAELSGGYQQTIDHRETNIPEYQQNYEETYEPTPLQHFQPPMEMQAPTTNQAPMNEERIQEVAEAIIDEKWEDFAKDIKKVIEWKEKIEERVSKLEQQMIDLRLSIDSLTKSMLSKISGYDQNIVDVGTEIKAMEKVFQKVLPTLTESVNKLDRMTKGVKDQTQQNK